jgi:methionyl-tRNA formyltransferase
MTPSLPALPVPPISIVFCTSGGLAGAKVLRQLLGDTRIRIVAVVHSTRTFRIGQSQFAALQFSRRQFGFRYLTYLTLSSTLGDLLLSWRSASVKGQARRAGIRIVETDAINSPQTVEQLRALGADLILSAFFNQKIGGDVVSLTQHGALNLHPALLPHYRGVDPVFYSRLSGETQFGVTLHRISENFDEGNVLAQRIVPLKGDQSVLADTATLYEAGGKLLCDAVAANTIRNAGVAQADVGNKSHYDSWPNHAAVAKLHSLGHKLWRMQDILKMLGKPRQ